MWQIDQPDWLYTCAAALLDCERRCWQEMTAKTTKIRARLLREDEEMPLTTKLDFLNTFSSFRELLFVVIHTYIFCINDESEVFPLNFSR